jgi:hypothetical protein
MLKRYMLLLYMICVRLSISFAVYKADYVLVGDVACLSSQSVNVYYKQGLEFLFVVDTSALA